ncbi:Conserved TM helix repeat-containing protein [Thalassoporum mexicanum PCC 7367]|uniref:mechanosensitive ion channel n=1 Tax=Thalassoporum mexicanum TaxID=3457544 RepID=UPI00029F8F4E|nr:mechanosensitive ion channel [Pseudanabaena sp. PCC 7367]AFY71669.1 Conserved TM helix repeat-containing protein [Pseudanabaena sp. PCC 7367]
MGINLFTNLVDRPIPWLDHSFVSLTNLPTSPLVAQANSSAASNFLSSLGLEAEDAVIQIVLAILILVVGWIVAIVLASSVEKLLKRTQIDNRIAGWITGSDGASNNFPIEKWVGRVVFYLIMLFVLVLFLQFLSVEASPISSFLEEITIFLPKLGGAALLIGLAWAIASVARVVIVRTLHGVEFDQQVEQQVGDTDPATETVALTETIANVVYWFIYLLFLPLVLNTLGLQAALDPVVNLVDQFLSALPRIAKAALIIGGGWLLAQIVRRLLTNSLSAAGLDRIINERDLLPTPGQQSLSWLIGTVVYVLILIPFAIGALDALGIEAISDPASDMLNQVMAALPKLFTAAVILTVFYVVGQFVRQIVTNILTGVGFNRLPVILGLPEDFGQTTPTVDATNVVSSTVEPTEPPAKATPSEIMGVIAFIAVMFIAVIASTEILEIESLTEIVVVILAIAGQVGVGLVIFAIGLYLANLAFQLISSPGGRQARIVAHAARISIVVLVIAMALKQMGIASNIVDLAFGLLLGAIAVAIALAFGLGGRDIAAEQIRAWLENFKRNDDNQNHY